MLYWMGCDAITGGLKWGTLVFLLLVQFYRRKYLPEKSGGGVPAKYIMKVDEFAEKCKRGKGNVSIGSGNKREILEEYFL